jgi:hypothetical protein
MRTNSSDGLKISAIIIVGVLILCNVEGAATQQKQAVRITLTERGVGPITSTTPFNLAAVAKLLLNLRVVKGIASSEGFDR